MEQFIMNGGKPLIGEVNIGGAKNAALPILTAAIIPNSDVVIHNLPDVMDIRVMIEAIQEIGGKAQWVDSGTLLVNGSGIKSTMVNGPAIKKIRASYYFVGALLAKHKSAHVLLPGGCNIGSRPIDQHIKGFRALNAEVSIEHGIISTITNHLQANHIFLDVVSVGATINIMLAATLADGKTVIENAAKEPHVVDVANFLNSMGANIKGAGTDIIRIKGVEALHGSEYSIIPDQIEAGTFMFASPATCGDIIVKNIIPKHMEATTSKLLEMGCIITEYDDAIRVNSRNIQLNATQIKTQPYPGFPTDLQPQIVAALVKAKGTSIITESIFENRFKYVDELVKMGASIIVEGNSAIVKGVNSLTGATLNSPDLRAGAALVLAGLSAQGISKIEDIEFIKRGYENYDEKLRQLGADIRINII